MFLVWLKAAQKEDLFERHVFCLPEVYLCIYIYYIYILFFIFFHSLPLCVSFCFFFVCFCVSLFLCLFSVYVFVYNYFPRKEGCLSMNMFLYNHYNLYIY